MKIIQKLITPILIVFALGGFMVLSSSDAHAAACAPGSSAKDCVIDGSNVKTGAGDTSIQALIGKITDILLFVLGAIAVIMIVVGGIRYAVSGGDSSAITSAKNTILYAVIGLVVALLAYAIVHFVVKAFVAVELATHVVIS